MEAHEYAVPGDRRRVDVRIPAKPGLVPSLRHALGALDLPPRLLDDARLLLSELLGNSIRHAGLGPDDQVRVRAEWSGTKLRVDVWDRAQVPAAGQPAGAIRPDPGSESGWGLYLVDSMAARWGSVPGRYWFELEDEQGGRQP